jgi:peptidoglycan biosynthesis protein MviN/MurJ (putative lipid II flippase)
MMVVVNVALNLVLVFPFQERGLAATTAFCAVAQVVWLFRLLCRRLPEIHPRPLIRSLFRIGAATGVMTVALAVLQFSAWLNSWIGSSQLVRLGLSVSAGVVIFIVAAKLLGLEEWDWTVHRKVPGGN